MTKVQKTKEERVKETITILKQLLDIGISQKDPSYKEIKSRFDDWIQTGDPWSGSIHLARYGRKAEIELPRSGLVAASLNLRRLIS